MNITEEKGEEGMVSLNDLLWNPEDNMDKSEEGIISTNRVGGEIQKNCMYAFCLPALFELACISPAQKMNCINLN